MQPTGPPIGLIVGAVLGAFVYWVLAIRIGRLIDNRRGVDHTFRFAWVNATTAGGIAVLVAAVVASTRGWSWWEVSLTAAAAGIVVGPLVAAILYRRTRPVRRAGSPEDRTADTIERNRLRVRLAGQLEREPVLVAWTRVQPFLTDLAEYRYGRAVAAEIALLTRLEAMSVTAPEPPSEWTVLVELPPEPAPVTHPEQRWLRDALGAAGSTVRLSDTRGHTTPDRRWDPLAEALKAGRAGRRRRGATREILGLRRDMRRHLHKARRRFHDDPELYRLGLPFAILFGQHGGELEWPWPPPSDKAWVPRELTRACIIATTYPGMENPANLP